MDGLQTTIAKLAAMKSRMNELASASRQQFAGPSPLQETAKFGRNPGKLRMLHHLPADLPAAPALVVALHGCTQTAASYDDGSGWSTLAERHGFALLMPEQQPPNNPNLCFNWFEPAHTRRGGGEALSIHQMIKCMIANHGIDASRVFIVGLSAGGAMTSAMLAAYPEVFNAGAVIAGLPAGAAANLGEAMGVMRSGRERAPVEWGDVVRLASPHNGSWPRVSVWHGDSDPVVHPDNAESIVQQWLDVHLLAAAPDVDQSQPGSRRRVWRDGDGTDLVESFTLAGMSHGVPIGLDDDDRCGRAGPLHFDVGISSATSIVRFWNIAAAHPRPSAAEAPAVRRATSASKKAIDPQDVIAKALRAAGLVAAGDAAGRGAAANAAPLDPAKIIENVLRASGVLKS